MQQQLDPVYVLREQIRQAKKQFRFDCDNSFSLFRPAFGFVYAYDMVKVEAALTQFEQAAGTTLLPLR